MVKIKEESCPKQTFCISEKKITVYPTSVRDRPVVYLNTFSEEGGSVHQALSNIDCKDFTLVTISGLTWNHDMAPWDMSISENDTPCTGGANEYLQFMSNEIIPAAEKYISGRILWRGLAGYSLAGLFALYSLYHTKLFSRIASISGSLWFPGFKDYVFSHEMKISPEHLYLSLGDRECKTNNPYLKTVQEYTEEIRDFYTNKGIDTEFQLNQGGHFKNAVQRTTSGIAWILRKKFLFS